MRNRQIAIVGSAILLAVISLVLVQLIWVNRALEMQQRNSNEELAQMQKSIAHRIEITELLTILNEVVAQSKQQGGHPFSPLAVFNLKRFLIDHLANEYAKIDNRELLAIFAFEHNPRGLSDTVYTAQAHTTTNNEFDRLVAGVNARLLENAGKPTQLRVPFVKIDSITQTTLSEQFEGQPISYEVVADTTKIATSNNSESHALVQPLFSNSAKPPVDYLVIHVPQRNANLLKQLFWLLIVSVAIFIIIGFSFYYMASIIFKQKKIQQMRTDFINNMTHEFKTPVATITLASEAILEESTNQPLMQRFGRMIYDENQRLKKQVERILNIALLDKPDFQLRLGSLNVDTVIRKVLQQLELNLKEKDARIEYKQYSESNIIEGDEVHITNVIYNLIDNAIKYSKDQLLISITTQNTQEGISISIEDNGIGMTAEQIRRIFEQFYRAHTGNVHNVKGFGLGLSYVKRIMETHNGTILVSSQPGKGSKFDLFFPFMQKAK